MEQDNKIKNTLYDYLGKFTEEEIQTLLKKNVSEFIKNVLKECYPKIIQIEKLSSVEEKTGTLAEGIMHFLLTNLLISSQRKAQYENTEIDIVIPDMKTLETNPQDALIINFLKTNDVDSIKKKLNEIHNIQPKKENSWIVSHKNIENISRSYTINENLDCSFTEIISDIKKFLSSKKDNKFKIFKTGYETPI